MDRLRELIPSREDWDTLRKYGLVMKENAGSSAYYVLPVFVSSVCGFARGLAGNSNGANYATDIAIAAGIVSGVKVAATTFSNHFFESLLENNTRLEAAEHAMCGILVPTGAVVAANIGAYEGFRRLGESISPWK